MNVKPSLSALNALRPGSAREVDRSQLAATKIKALNRQKTPEAASEKAVVSRPGRIDPKFLTRPSAAPTQTPPEVAPTSSPPLSVEGLREAWGTDDARYDFNADGTVDSLDLLELLARIGAGPQEEIDSVDGLGAPTEITETADETADDDADEANLSVDGLYKAWGTDDPQYDLNADGVVDALDLLSLLERLGQEQPGAEKIASTLEGSPSATAIDEGKVIEDPGPLTVEGLREAWGTDNPQYDLNGDGTVDALDMLALLAQLRDEPTPEANNIFAQGGVSSSDAPGAPGAGEEQLSIEGLREAWGTDDARYDFNADGTVDSLDMLAFLAQMRGETEEANAPSRGRPGLAGRADEALAAAGPNGPASLAATIGDQLRDAGFQHQPPSNIHEIIDRFELPRTAQKSVLKHLAARYPGGLGVNKIV